MVFTRPDGIADATIAAAVRSGWGFDAVAADYLPAGFGSHHWVARDATGDRRFVTVDDLGSRDFLGSDPPSAFDGLSRAMATTCALSETGLDWVVAPLRDTSGEPLRWLDATYSIAVFPFVDGFSTREYASEEERSGVISLLAQLHQSAGQVAAMARRETFAVPSRAELEAAMDALPTTWTGGRYAESARELLSEHLEGVRRHLSAYDELVQAARAEPQGWSLTHGEPHSANVLRTDDGFRLIDWDTALVAPVERDLWMLMNFPDDQLARQYSSLTGRAVDRSALRLYALWWDLCEISIYIAQFRADHEDTEDTAVAWENLQHFIRGYQRA